MPNDTIPPVYQYLLNGINRSAYDTSLNSDEEQAYRNWVVQNNLLDRGIDPNTFTGTDYDMRGFFRGLITGDPRATSGINPIDQQLHFTDTWKKPTHETFSNESIYATGENKKKAGSWKGEIFTPPKNYYKPDLMVDAMGEYLKGNK